MSKFKIGDEVICKDNDNHYLLTVGKKYKIKQIDTYYNREYIFVINDIDRGDFYKSILFEMCIKYERKEKLKKLCLNEETK